MRFSDVSLVPRCGGTLGLERVRILAVKQGPEHRMYENRGWVRTRTPGVIAHEVAVMFFESLVPCVSTLLLCGSQILHGMKR